MFDTEGLAGRLCDEEGACCSSPRRGRACWSSPRWEGLAGRFHDGEWACWSSTHLHDREGACWSSDKSMEELAARLGFYRVQSHPLLDLIGRIKTVGESWKANHILNGSLYIHIIVICVIPTHKDEYGYL